MFKSPPTVINQIVGISVEDSFESLFIHEFNLELSAFDSLNQVGEAVVICSLVASSIIGSYCKSSIYYYIYQKSKEKGNTVIDILLLVNTIVQHLVCVLLTTFYTIGLAFDITYSDFFGEAWCNIPWYLGVFGGAYRTFGSLVVAVYRLLLINDKHKVTGIGKRKLVSIFLVLTFAISAGVTVGFGTGNGPGSRKQVTWNWCIGESEHFREIEHEYSLITGTVPDESELLAKLCLLIPLIGNMIELCCYLFFFGHLYFHDRSMLKRKVFKEPEFKRRRHINAMSFMGQFYGFVVECITYIGFMLTLEAGSNISYRLALAIGFWVEFGISSIVEVSLSQNLRECLPHIRYSR
jgi:hypothetical protein